MPSLTEEQIKKAFDKLKLWEVTFPYTVDLKVGTYVHKLTFQEDGSYTRGEQEEAEKED